MKNKFLVFIFALLPLLACGQSNKSTALIQSFRQGKAGNCASIAVIKLAIAKYGTQGVFQKLDSTESEYVITLQNDTTLTLTKSERRQLGKLDHFEIGPSGGDLSLLRTAKFLYAIMAKNKFLIGNRIVAGTYASVAEAAKCKDSEGNENWLLVKDTAENFKLLGLGSKFATLSPRQAKSTADVIMANLKHAAYSNLGVYDEMGTVNKVSRFKFKHGFWPFTSYYLAR